MTSRFILTGKTLGLAVGVMVTARCWPKAALERAIERERTEIHGRCLGLTAEQVEMVTAAMVERYAESYTAGFWQDVQDRLTLLGMGLEWRT